MNDESSLSSNQSCDKDVQSGVALTGRHRKKRKELPVGKENN